MSDIARKFILNIINFSKSCFRAFASFFQSKNKNDESDGNIEFTTFENENHEPDHESGEDTNSFDVCELTEEESSDLSTSSIEIIEDPGKDAELAAKEEQNIDTSNMDSFIMALSMKIQNLGPDQMDKIRKDTVDQIDTIFQKYHAENSSDDAPRA